MQHNTKIPMFRRFVMQNFPFIEEDFDALTDYALMSKIIEYLNMVIKSQNEVSSAMQELQDFVSHYFDNLDVQEEINNKLDQMAEDGTLEEIIGEYLNASAIWGFDTVADMKAATNLINGSFAETYGFYTKGDKGGAKYKIRNITNDDVVDESFIIALSDENLVAELLIEEDLYSKQIGLKGDGTTDETTLLNTFYAKSLDCNKILNSGVYKITDTVYIKGLWRQNSGNNGQRQFIFENATILYNGNENEASVVLYNMFKTAVRGLCIARNSTANYVEMTGCWHVNCTDWDIKDLHIDTLATNLEGKTYETLSNEYISFKDLYVLGTLTINAETSKYTNCINFYNSIMYSNGKNYCVELTGPVGKQAVNFYNCDMSYASSAVFNIPVAQTGAPVVNCFGCYFDSGIKMFANDNKNGIQFNNLAGMLTAYGNNEIINIKQTDFVNNTNIMGAGVHGWNLPTMNVNLAQNGNISTTPSISAHYTELFGSSSTLWTKAYIDSNLSPSGKARKITLGTLTGDYAPITIMGINAPRAGKYTGYARFKIVSGTCTKITGIMKNNYYDYSYDRVGSDEIIMVLSKDNTFSANEALSFSLYFYGPSSDFAVEFYEVGIVEGMLYTPNAPLHNAAILSD